MKKARQEYRFGIGAASMLLIFIILCVTTLSVLSLSGARADMALAKRNRDMQLAYAHAAVKVQEVLAEVDAFLLSARSIAASQEEYEGLIQALHIALPYFEVSGSDIFFDVDAGFERSIEVFLSVLPYEETESGRYRIARHALRNDALWETEEESFSLFFGE